MTAATDDWFRQPGAAFLWWCLPLGLGFAMNLFAIPPRVDALVWAVLFVWMGVGCVLNARRCHRLHCYISAPIFLFGAVATALFAADVLHGRLTNIVSAVLILALLSFAPEFFWTRYRGAQH